MPENRSERKIKISTVLIITGVLGIISKNLEKCLEHLKIQRMHETIQILLVILKGQNTEGYWFIEAESLSLAHQ